MPSDKEKGEKLTNQIRRFIKGYEVILIIIIVGIVLTIAAIATSVSSLIISTENVGGPDSCTSVSCNNPDICTTAACIDGQCQILNAIPGCCADTVNDCQGVVTGSYIFGTIRVNNISRNTGNSVIIEQVQLSGDNITCGFSNCDTVVTSSLLLENNIVNYTSTSFNSYEQIRFTTSWLSDLNDTFFAGYNMTMVLSGTIVSLTMLQSPATNLTGVTFLASVTPIPTRYRPLYTNLYYPIRILNAGTASFGLFLVETSGTLKIYATVTQTGNFTIGISGFYASGFSWNVSP